MSKKMGFVSVLSLVFGSQIGSGIFVLPATLAPFGIFGVYAWALAGIGAILLAFVFAGLCSNLPKTGGPHVYVQQVFGKKIGFFVGWAYWLVSWISTSVVFIAAIAALSVFFEKDSSPYVYLLLEIALLSVVTAINCRSVNFAGKVESFLAALKFIPFVIVPVMLFGSFDIKNISMSEEYADFSAIKLMIMVTMTSFWGFIGVESATAPAGIVENPSKTIPKAIIIGTLGVTIIYVISSLSVMGVVPSSMLATSKSPYVDAINLVLGENLSKIVSLVTFIIMVGTANAWTLSAAQVSLGLAEDKLLPSFFAKTNKNSAPYISILVSSLGMIPILILSINPNISSQISDIIDFSVGVFLMIYATCCLAFIKINMKKKNTINAVIGGAAFLFCLLVIANSSIQSTMVSLLFIATGVFMLPFAKIRCETSN
jgi:APA family basic amino acid/polyamine antiporter